MDYNDIPEIEGFPKIPLGKTKYNLVNYSNNHLTALYRTSPPGVTRDSYWVCKCDCGKYTVVRARDIISGRIQSCGHIIYKDLIGKRIGKLTILEPSEFRSNTCVKWKCQCDCGNICYVSSHHLSDNKNLQTLSCGCLKTENAHNRDITNQKFGKLTAVFPTDKRSAYGSIIWHCQCDCGNFVDVDIHMLISGKIRSCGCLKTSAGEYTIEQLLLTNNINYQKQVRFEDCKDIYALPFDFQINNSYLIEFDGLQHYESREFFGGEQNFQILQQHDKIKNEYCKTHHIPLIRIPYTILSQLNIQDLQLETTKYRIC